MLATINTAFDREPSRSNVLIVLKRVSSRTQNPQPAVKCWGVLTLRSNQPGLDDRYAQFQGDAKNKYAYRIHDLLPTATPWEQARQGMKGQGGNRVSLYRHYHPRKTAFLRAGRGRRRKVWPGRVRS